MTNRTTTTTITEQLGSLALKGQYQPLQPSGILDQFKPVELTPVIGTEFNNGTQISDLLDAPNADELLKELAIQVSRRNVIFFRKQKAQLTDYQIKTLTDKLGILSGRPAESHLHIHPTEQAPHDDELSPINPSFIKRKPLNMSQLATAGWHSDITFEKAPSDFAVLNMHTLPDSAGGDTVWASAYEAYDRLSPSYAKWLETLTATHDGSVFNRKAESLGIRFYDAERGHPENIGKELISVHPVIRTNPVTGWKGLFVNPGFTKKINELTYDESEQTLAYLFRVIHENHDLQVRYRWELNDVAIWSNTSSFHNVTVDYTKGTRAGNRCVSIGEKPFFDPASKSRRADLDLVPWL